jgi:hypothetical protein
MIEEPNPQENETTKQEECYPPQKIGRVYIIIGPGKLHEKSYVRYVGKTIQELKHYLAKSISKA